MQTADEAVQALEAALAEDSPEPEAPVAGAHSSPESPDSTDTNISLETAGIDDLLAALDLASANERNNPDAKATEQTPAAIAAPVEPAAPAAPETTEEDDDDLTLPPEPTAPAKNFRLHTDDPKLGAFLKTLKSAQAANPNVNPAEVAALVGYSLPSAAAAPAAPAASSEPPPIHPRVQNLRAEIEQLKADIKHARTVTYEAEVAEDKTQELFAKMIDLKQTEEEVRAQAIADAEFKAGEQAALDEAFRLSPESETQDSEQYDAIVAERARLKRDNPALLSRPDYALVILKLAAARKPALFPNVVKKAVPTAPVAAPVKTVAKPGQPTSRPVGVTVPGNHPGPTLTASNAKETMASLSADQLVAALDRASAIELNRQR